MLAPGDRRLFLDALRPPEGYSFDLAVGTTYTLDLLALLAVPLAFTFRDAQDGDGQLAADPLALLESAWRHTGRIVLFCHGGQTSVPRSRQPALVFLEQSVVTALPPRVDETQAVFHPKAWALRYPESTEAMGRGVDTRDDGQGKANGASPIPIDGDEGGVR